MPIINRIAEFQSELTAWRRELHRHPETAFEEEWTSAFVAEKLESFGLEVHRNIAKTGLVAVLRGQTDNGRAIGLRADMDALDITEATGVPYASERPGKMHACGHDGHTVMLLGAARYMAETRNFDGTVYFVFQPAEENEGGARVMIEEGLFDRFPMDAVYGMHNRPGLPVGRMQMREGPSMAGFDIFEITIDGYGTHAARPHQGIDPVVVQAQIVMALQTIASRQVDPIESVVLSVTQVHGGDTWNVIPPRVVLRGTVRCFKPEVQDQTEASMRRICANIAAAYDARVEVRYERRYPPLSNDPAHIALCAEVASEVCGADNVTVGSPPGMGSEDFAFMLQEKPGAYVNIGNGALGQHGGTVVHNPGYDFNDEALTWGATFWTRLAEKALPRG
ncbi:amidohydrolase [Constrictibacter sp. MBR-5]|jgi:hippurate hydrolase|uniref:M20 aminoacylase family protein n=1 Tax=Constrictibacter sp. MBR-5 TaxID=3156467 RepID=UPI0033944052